MYLDYPNEFTHMHGLTGNRVGLAKERREEGGGGHTPQQDRQAVWFIGHCVGLTLTEGGYSH